MADSYTYVFGFPLNALNVIWTAVTLILSLMYFNNFCASRNLLSNATKYFTAYGKAKVESNSFDLPKRYFSHFYILASVWNTSCLVLILGICYDVFFHNWLADIFQLKETDGKNGDQLSIVLVMFLLCIHIYKRLYECLAISVFSSKSKINFIQYVWGLLHYLILAPTVISESLPLTKLPFGSLGLHHIIGIAGFCFASIVHHHTHVIFADMRKKGGVRNDDHGIPTGGMFSLVSCPHYFAEVFIYFCFLVILKDQCYSFWLVILYNVVTHMNMGKNSHEWYKKTFPAYPKSRRVFIPYLC